MTGPSAVGSIGMFTLNILIFSPAAQGQRAPTLEQGS